MERRHLQLDIAIVAAIVALLAGGVLGYLLAFFGLLLVVSEFFEDVL
jgi:ABC-type dipeptide/oligopeptide/nickel transport system permease subunit